MKRFLVLLGAAVPLGLTACGQPEVVVEASIAQQESSERLTLSDLPIRLLPYDRDAIFDSLEAAADQPEPEIPAEIQQAQEQVQQAQQEWRTAEERWATVRDSLRSLSERLQQMQNQGLRATPQYQQAFRQFGQLEPQEQQFKQRSEAAFERFTQLQQETLARVDSVRAVRDAWAEEAFRDFNQIVAARMQARGYEEEFADTTNAAGLAVIRVPDEGRWWVYARYTLPYEELYWNVPVEVTGDSVHVSLSEENAERRPVM